MGIKHKVPGSFRDPSGYLFLRGGLLYRRIEPVYAGDYDRLMGSGLYKALNEARLLIAHEEVPAEPGDEGAHAIIMPQAVPFISYPYEWSFSQLKDAALATLAVQKKAMEYGITLKDASAYNIQFFRGEPVLIDTLSFKKYAEGETWAAYRQFCQHFLAPLALMGRRDIRLGQLLKIHVDGIPLDLASSLLPPGSWLSFSLLMHIHLHAQSLKHFSGRPAGTGRSGMSRTALSGLIDSLESAIAGLSWKPQGTEWAEYYDNNNYSREAFQSKVRLAGGFLERIKAATVWDLGANTGVFSRVAVEKGSAVISFDADPAAVEKNYLGRSNEERARVLPLLLDLTNPSPDLGWANEERASLIRRGPADAVLALALIHHLAISNNVPLDGIAEFFSRLCRHLIVEFVPKSDSKVQTLLAGREDIFPNYTVEGFEKAFAGFFTIESKMQIAGCGRLLYLMTNLRPPDKARAEA